MKKLALLASAVAVSAAVADTPAASATGFYTGLNLGVASTQNKQTGKNGPDNSYSVRQSGNGVQYGVFGGYNAGLGGNFVVGMELFLGGDSAKISSSSTEAGVVYSQQVKRTVYYGLAPRAGYMITSNVLAYIRLGLEGGSWKYSEVTSDPNPNSSVKKNTISFAPGIGFDIFTAKNMFVRAQYHHLFGPKLTAQTSTGNQNTQNKISQNVFTLAVGYKF